MTQQTLQLMIDGQSYILDTTIKFSRHPDEDGKALFKLEGQLRKVTHDIQLPAADANKHIILVIDTSGSMESCIKIVKDGAIAAIENLNLGDEVSVITFDSKSKILGRNVKISDSTAKKNLIKAINEAELSGNTRLDLALSDLQTVAISNHLTTTAYLLTDGKTGGPDFDAALRNLKQHCGDNLPRIYPVGLGAAVNYDTLDQLAELTGAVAQHITSAKQFSQILTNPALFRARLPIKVRLQSGAFKQEIDLKQIVIDAPFAIPLQEADLTELDGQAQVQFEVNGQHYSLNLALDRNQLAHFENPVLIEEYYMNELLRIFDDSKIPAPEKRAWLNDMKRYFQRKENPLLTHSQQAAMANFIQELITAWDAKDQNRVFGKIIRAKTLVSNQPALHLTSGLAPNPTEPTLELDSAETFSNTIDPATVQTAPEKTCPPDNLSALNENNLSQVKERINILKNKMPALTPYGRLVRQAKISALEDLAALLEPDNYQSATRILNTINGILATYPQAQVGLVSKTAKLFDKVRWSYMNAVEIEAEIQKLSGTQMQEKGDKVHWGLFNRRKESKITFLAKLQAAVASGDKTAILALKEESFVAFKGILSQRVKELYNNLIASPWFEALPVTTPAKVEENHLV